MTGSMLDRDARIIADFLTAAGQPVEQGCCVNPRLGVQF